MLFFMKGGFIVLLATSLDTLTQAFSWILDNFKAFAENMLSTPLFLIPVAIFCVGACIGLVKRLV